LAYISVAESIRVSSTNLTQSAQKGTEFGEIKQLLGLLRSSRSFKVTDFGTNRELICNFLLVTIISFPRYSLGKVQNRYLWLLLFGLTPPMEGFPWDDLRKMLPTSKSIDVHRTKWRENIAENFNRLSRVHERYRRQTDDRRTDDDISLKLLSFSLISCVYSYAIVCTWL